MISQTNQVKRLSVRYFGALHAAVGACSTEAAAQRAEELGNQALALGLGTSEMAKIHDEALSELTPCDGVKATDQRLKARAAVFFSAMLLPLERGHAAALRAATGIRTVKRALLRRTRELASADQKLKEGIVKRKTADAFLRTSRIKSARLLKESRLLEVDLKTATQKLIQTQEAVRTKMSSKLHEEIAVTLLAIHVRLLALKKEAAVHQVRLSREIVNSRRLVEQSIKTIHHFNREFGIQHET